MLIYRNGLIRSGSITMIKYFFVTKLTYSNNIKIEGEKTKCKRRENLGFSKNKQKTQRE